MRFIGDASTRVAALENGEIQYGSLSAIPNIDVVRVGKLPGIEYTTKGNEVINPTVQIEINTKRKPLDNPKVRQALAYAIDRQFIVDNMWYGFGKPATGPMHSNLTSIGLYTTEGIPNFDRPDRVEFASRLLDEAGLPATASGFRFEITLDPILTGAVIASGTLVVERNVKKVQHSYGGIVAAINVKNGDAVAAGDVLIRLDDTQINAELGSSARSSSSSRRALHVLPQRW